MCGLGMRLEYVMRLECVWSGNEAGECSGLGLILYTPVCSVPLGGVR